MAEPRVRFAVADGIASIVLDRPQTLNALDTTLRDELIAAIAQADEDDAVRVITLAGAGDRAFSVGADVKEFARKREDGADGGGGAALRRSGAPSVMEAVDNASKPTVAGIRGYCLGGGLELALACDIRICSADARFALPEVTLGMVPSGGGTQRLARVVGPGNALYMVLTGEKIDAATALTIGLVSKVVTPETVDGELRAVAARIAANAPIAVQLARRAVRAAGDTSLAAGLDLERGLGTIAQRSEDRSEGLRAFVEKRAPRYRGR